jgi:hypothetical protein
VSLDIAVSIATEWNGRPGKVPARQSTGDLNARRKKKFMDDGIGLGDRLGRMLRQ